MSKKKCEKNVEKKNAKNKKAFLCKKCGIGSNKDRKLCKPEKAKS